jgi:hypothetical protein
MFSEKTAAPGYRDGGGGMEDGESPQVQGEKSGAALSGLPQVIAGEFRRQTRNKGYRWTAAFIRWTVARWTVALIKATGGHARLS